MAEEVIGQMSNVWELYQMISQIYPSPDDLCRRPLLENEVFLMQEGDDMELRRYRIVDADGNEFKWPLKLISNIRVVM